MKKLTTPLVLLLLVVVAGFSAKAQFARVQAIHNSADPAAASVDVWATGIPGGDILIADNFTFRSATGFFDVPGSIPVTLVVAPDTSTSSASGIASFPIGALTAGETYVVVANGVLNPGAFAGNPDAIPTAFNLDIYAGAIDETATNPSTVDVLVHHGSTDAPSVDVDVRGLGTIVDNAPFRAFAEVPAAPAAKLILDVKDSTNSVTVASFYADLTGLASQAVTVFASGFLGSGQGEAFGLYAALANGAVVKLPQIETAKVQAIHNSADPAAALVDVYITTDAAVGADTIKLDNVAFRDATAFLDLPSNIPVTIHVALPTSTSVLGAIASIPVGALTTDEKYVLIANGVLTPGSFTANPDARMIGFDLYPTGGGRETSVGSASDVDLLIFHGATDAPTVDVIARDVATLADDLVYGDYNTPGYVTVPAGSYTVDITTGMNTATVASYTADVSGLGGGAAVVFASGFLDANQGDAFGVWVALTDGTTFPLPQLTPTGTARVQVIHNAADPAAATVDVKINSSITLNDFSFRDATGFVDLPSGVPLSIEVLDQTGTVSVATFNYDSLAAGETYILMANGVATPGSFTANPDAQSIAFDLYPFAPAQETGANGSGNVDLLIYHGATDAPMVDVVARGTGLTLADDLVYGNYNTPGYITVPAASYTIDITTGMNTATVASYTADVSGLGGGAAVVFASGFLDDSQGDAFGIWVALADGTTFPLPAIAPTGTARVQIIHNAADPAAASVDAQINSSWALDNFGFRDATGFIDLPGGVPLYIEVFDPSGSTSVTSFTYDSLQSGATYILIANGVLNTGSFDANPGSLPIAFDLYPFAPGQETGSGTSSEVDLLIFHGATDAPSVDVIARGVATLADDIAYGSYNTPGYVTVPAASYTIDVTTADNSANVASYIADVSSLGGGAAVVFASGFLNAAQGDAFEPWVALADGTTFPLPASTPTGIARVQVIHNAADPAAATVDVRINNGQAYLDNVSFRDATAFTDLPGGVPISIEVLDPTGTTTIATFNYDSLASGETYVLMANGVATPGSFTANPSGESIAFDLYPFGQGQEAGLNGSGNVDLLIYHGATDAPMVDVIARDVATLADDLVYGNYNTPGYINVPAGSYIIDITTGMNTATVASYTADVSSLGGGAAVVFASGFLDDNQGDAFGIWVALADGTTFPLPAITATGTARVQVIHNAADPAAATVDVKINSSITIDDFDFRSATDFIDLPGGVPLSIEILDATGTTSVTTFNYDSIASGQTYVLMANGVVTPGSFTANPSAVNIGFDLYPFAPAQESGANGATNVDLLIYHGATDAPGVDVVVPGGGPTLADNIVYGDFNAPGYISVPAASYEVDITDSTQANVVAEYTADISALGGGAAVVFASGFLDDSQGEAFQIWVALADGTTFALPTRVTASGTARVQVIHNAADPAAATVDVLINGALLPALDNFAFRSATPFVDLPSGLPVSIEVTAPDSSASIATFNYDSLEAGKTYVIIANGVANPGNFTANPDGESIAFDLYLNDMGQETATNTGKTDLLVFHGATDAPTVDVVANQAVTLVDGASYGDFAGYAEVDPIEYRIDITSDDQSTTIASYAAPLTTASDAAAVVFASGFVDDSQGEAFGIWVALADGTTFPLPAFVGIDEVAFAEGLNVYPIPAIDNVNIELTLDEEVDVKYEVINSLGQVVSAANLGTLSAGSNNIPVNVSTFSTGIYLLNIVVNEESNFTRTLVVE